MYQIQHTDKEACDVWEEPRRERACLWLRPLIDAHATLTLRVDLLDVCNLFTAARANDLNQCFLICS